MMIRMAVMMMMNTVDVKLKKQSSVYLLPTMFVKHFPGQLLVGLMVEEGKGGPMILTKGKLKKKCFKLLII